MLFKDTILFVSVISGKGRLISVFYLYEPRIKKLIKGSYMMCNISDKYLLEVLQYISETMPLQCHNVNTFIAKYRDFKAVKGKRKAMTRNWYNQNLNPVLETKVGNTKNYKIIDIMQGESAGNRLRSSFSDGGHSSTLTEPNIHTKGEDSTETNNRENHNTTTAMER